MAERCCPKCGSSNISFQREQTASIGASSHHINKRKHHSIMYWIFIGSWIWMFKLAFEMFRLLIFLCTFGLLGHKKDKSAVGKTISVNKSINRTMALCQNCGYSWKI
jgi:hypothetical protein